MAGVVVGLALHLARAQRQHRLGPVERLDLGLLVQTEHDRVGRRSQVQTDHVADLRLGLGSVLNLKVSTRWGWRPRSRQTRCTVSGLIPVALGDLADAPVGQSLGRRLQGQRHDTRTLGLGQLWRATERGRSIRPASPCSAKRRRHPADLDRRVAREPRHFDAAHIVGHQQHRSGTPTQPRRSRRRTLQPLQFNRSEAANSIDRAWLAMGPLSPASTAMILT